MFSGMLLGMPPFHSSQPEQYSETFHRKKSALSIPGVFFCSLLLSLLVAITGNAQTVTTVATFDGTDGGFPGGGLVQGLDGNFYGTASFGGANNSTDCENNGCGTIFKMSPGGTITTLYSFCSLANCADGFFPSGLLLASDGNLYGATGYGGAEGDCSFGGLPGCGTIFRITPGGTFTTLHTFTGKDGASPGALTQAADGTLYGTTRFGGLNHNSPGCTSGCGTAFRINLSGSTFARIYNFCSLADCADGQDPGVSLLQGSDGNFYGVTRFGGTGNTGLNCGDGCGTVFRLTPGGVLTTLHNFTGAPEGAGPVGSLIQGVDGFFYGTTSSGGYSPKLGPDQSTCEGGGCGTVFKISPVGSLATLFRFCTASECPDGSGPEDLVQATDGNFYFPTSDACCGPPFTGTIFKLTPAGYASVLCNFTGIRDYPSSSLVQSTDGSFYGENSSGEDGAVYNLNVGLGPFVMALRSFGIAGSTVTILGTNLTGASAVDFNGTSADFTVVSGSEITATVPAAALTGKIQVTTPSGTFSSNRPFQVTPQVLSFSPTSGAAGSSVTITGESLTGARAVSFGGVLAKAFIVDSNTQMTATVPAGAKSGVIAVATAGGRGQSKATFTVTP